MFSRSAPASARIDAAVAMAFELGMDDLVLLLADFPSWTVTSRSRKVTERGRRDLLLATFAAITGAEAVSLTDLGLPVDCGPRVLLDRVLWAEEQGQLAYIPGELARQFSCRKAARLRR